MLDITKSLIYIDGKERTRELDRCSISHSQAITNK